MIERTYWRFTTFKSLTDTRATAHQCHFHDLVKGFLTSPGGNLVSEKKTLPLWSPTEFKQGRRARANATDIYFLVYDIDDGMTPFDTWRLFSDYHVLAHTSFSHKPQHHKYRIILPLQNPIPARNWGRASQAAQELWDSVVGRGTPDQAALHDRARVYFRYGIPTPPNEEMLAEDPLNPLMYHKTAWSTKSPLDLTYDHITEPTPRQPRKPVKARAHQNGKAAMSEVMEDPTFRLAVAHKVGATIQENNARYIRCPGCGRDSVHFSIDISVPGSYKWPTCNHLNRCAWWGRFEDLI